MEILSSELEKQAKTLTLRVKKITNEEYFDLLQEKHSLKVQLEQARTILPESCENCKDYDLKMMECRLSACPIIKKLYGVLGEGKQEEKTEA